jgi:hypothetical protein
MFCCFKCLTDCPKVSASIDVPLDIVTRLLGSEAVEAILDVSLTRGVRNVGIAWASLSWRLVGILRGWSVTGINQVLDIGANILDRIL